MGSERPNILIIDDDETAAEMCRVVLEGSGFDHITTCLDSREALPMIRKKRISVVLLDLFMPHISGQEILEELTREHPEIPTIVLTVEDSLETAVGCMKIGAFDFLTKPIDRNRLTNAVSTALRIRDLETRIDILSAERPEVGVQNPELFRSIVTRSDHMGRIFSYIEQIANSPKAVLVTGESGTGKELVARAVHDASGRKGRFVPVNVAGLDDTMFSDTLFGHRRGAFTGADSDRSGLIERATEGTLFLDEIGDLEQASQPKLLRL
ncbi:MAG: sigma-54-dependent transcriptional regulator, partial [Alkalispirochaetaceae bacterium]